jgi:phosphoribosylformylglycinamidine synthase
MTQTRYSTPIESFELGVIPEDWYDVDVLSAGRMALEDVNSHLGMYQLTWLLSLTHSLPS